MHTLLENQTHILFFTVSVLIQSELCFFLTWLVLVTLFSQSSIWSACLSLIPCKLILGTIQCTHLHPLATGIPKTMLGLYTVDNAWKKAVHTPPFWHSNYWHFSRWLSHYNFVTCLFQSSWDNLCFPEAILQTCAYSIFHMSLNMDPILFCTRPLQCNCFQIHWDHGASVQQLIGIFGCHHH